MSKPEVVAYMWEHRGRHACVDRAYAEQLMDDGEQVAPLIRLADHERLQAVHAADKYLIDQLYRQRDDYAMHNMAVRQCTGIPRSVGISEPVEGFEDRPQDLAPAMREMALIIEADKARIAELEAALSRAAAWIETLPVPTNGACAQLARIDAALAQQGKEGET